MGRNHFYDLYNYACVADDPTFVGYHFTSYDNPLLDPEEIEAAKKSMSAFSFRQEFMASFEAQGSELFKEAKQVIPGGVNSPVRAFKSVGGTPVFASRAKGAYVFDEDGSGTIDVCELHEAIVDLGTSEDGTDEVSLESVREIMNHIDLDGVGEINFPQFKRVVYTTAKKLPPTSS